jgi:hypothetical protein
MWPKVPGGSCATSCVMVETKPDLTLAEVQAALHEAAGVLGPMCAACP